MNQIIARRRVLSKPGRIGNLLSTVLLLETCVSRQPKERTESFEGSGVIEKDYEK